MYNLKKTALFADLSDEELNQALAKLSASGASYGKGQLLNRPGDVLGRFGLVLSGTIHVLHEDIDGNECLMATVPAGESFGESLCYLKKKADVIIRAAENAYVFWLDPKPLLENAPDPLCRKLMDRFTAGLAARALQMNTRIQILSKQRLRDKVMTLLESYSMKKGKNIELPMNREEMALYLGTNRSALSRELSAMQSEGLIRFDKNIFTIL